MKKTLTRYILLTPLLLFSMLSCVGDPEFPSEPKIGFESIRRSPFLFDPTNPNINGDTIEIIISFEDQEGDLGLGEQDVDNPDFNTYLPDSSLNKFRHNYFIEVFRKRTDETEFERVIFDSLQTFNGRFPRLNTSPNDQPLEGELRYAFGVLVNLTESPLQRGDSLKFEVQIADRQLQLSNAVMTDAVQLFGRLDDLE